MPLRSNRQDIVDAGMRLIQEKGYEAVSVDEISQAAGISKPTFYKYVKSKEDILHAYFQEEMRARWEQLEKLDSEDYWSKVWVVLYGTMARGVRLGPEIYGHYLQLLMHEHNPTSLYKSDLVDETYKNIRLAQEHGQILNQDDPEQLFLTIRNMALGLAFKWVMTDGSFELIPYFRELVETILLPQEDPNKLVCIV